MPNLTHFVAIYLMAYYHMQIQALKWSEWKNTIYIIDYYTFSLYFFNFNRTAV